MGLSPFPHLNSMYSSPSSCERRGQEHFPKAPSWKNTQEHSESHLPIPPSPALFPQHLGTSQSLDSHPGNPCASCFQLHSQRAPGKGGIGSPPCIDYSLWKSLGMLPSLFHILVTHRIWGSFCIIQWQPEGP